MACNGCGTSAGLTKEQVENLINLLIDEGKLQSGLVDCEDKRLWRDARVVTCGNAGADKYLKDVSYDQQTQTATFTMSDGNKHTLNLSALTKTKTGNGLQGDGTATSPVSIKIDPASSVALTASAYGLNLDANALKPIATVELVDLFAERIGYALTETERRGS